MTSRTSEEIFLFLVSNAIYDTAIHIPPTREEKIKRYKDLGTCFNKQYWADVESSVPHFLTPLKKLEKFLGEPYDFSKHMKPLVDQGRIFIRPFVNCFPHSAKLAKQTLKRHGIVKDYKTSIQYVQFYLGDKDPNISYDHWL